MKETKDRVVKDHGFCIGGVKLKNRVISAPMAGVTDKAFRILAREAECGLIYTEMVSATALHFNSERTRNMLDISGETGPTTIQIFGNKPDLIKEAALMAQEAGADIVDINMGCPAPKVVKNFEGCALMRDMELAGKIIDAVAGCLDIPLTVKIRKGWDENSVNAIELAKIAEKNGAAAVGIHGRTREQFYSGQADWEIIRRVKQEVSIPVIGNGDIFEPEDSIRMLSETGCDGVMIGRGALGNPWLFKRTVQLLQTGQASPAPNHLEKINMAKRHLALMVKIKGEQTAVKEMRKHIAWYIKGLRDSTTVRELINKAQTKEKLLNLLDEYGNFLEWT